MFYGGDYNPEQWPEEVWIEDARLMREAGVNLVSLGVFAWARLEPRPDEFDFEWFDRIMDLLHEHGVGVNLATATASPPPWLAKRHPETLPVTADGVRLWPGGRQHYCPSSPVYRGRAEGLVRRIAERYRDHPALKMWHINNEYGCHLSECHCDVSAESFRRWLGDRYGDIDSLNDAWGTAFWSQRYSDFSEINPPRRAPTFPNPTHVLDFRRFCSDELLGCYELEQAILRELTPGIPITTNFMGFWEPLDYWKWAPREDVVSHDCYPDPADPESHIAAAMSYDLMRSLGNGRPWILMEQTASHVNWRPVNVPKPPGVMRLWSYQAVGRGADGVMFFQWRASKAGAEKFHGGMVQHAGPRTRSWREVAALGRELATLEGLTGSTAKAEVAVLFDWNSWWALATPSKPSDQLSLMDEVYAYYRPLFDANIAVDFVPVDRELSGYRVVLAPNLFMMSKDTARRLREFVDAGGTLVVTFFSGIVDETDHIHLGGYPAPLSDVLGLVVDEFSPIPAGGPDVMVAADGREHSCSLWTDAVTIHGAEAVASYSSGVFAGSPAITRNRFGGGLAYYVGTRPTADFIREWLVEVCARAGVAGFAAPAGVEVTRRSGADVDYDFVLNHNQKSVAIEGLGEGRDLLSGTSTDGRIELGPAGVAVIARPREAVRAAAARNRGQF